MHKYKLVTIEEVSGVNLIQKLEINGKCQFDKFYDEIKNDGTYKAELDVIQAYLSKLGQNEDIPPKKFKELKGRKNNDNIKDYELITYNLRVYCIKGEKKNKIIIIAGKKTNQKKDIKNLRKIKLDFKKEA